MVKATFQELMDKYVIGSLSHVDNGPFHDISK